jgi:uncharacterized protein YjiS (DUF1127 family)
MTHVLPAHSAASALSRRISASVKSAWRDYWTRKTRRATVLILHALDDRTLKDIGMHRSEIESIVYSQAGNGAHQGGRLIRMCAERPRRIS